MAALLGVGFAAVLATVQSGLYEGFLYTTSNIITRMGGDVWITAAGVRVFDNVEPLSAGSRAHAAEHDCVKKVRPLVLGFSWLRTPNGSRETVRVVGTEGGAPYMPWDLARGLPSDLDGPMRVAVDELDLKRLGINGNPIGATLALMNQRAYVAAVARRARSFTLLPYVFARIENARMMTKLSDGQVTAWVVDLKDPACTNEVIATIQKHPELRAWSTRELREETQNFWLVSSGAGAILAFSALMGLLVGGVIVGQTLYAAVRDHEPELATLRAIGAAPWEVAGFVAVQASVLTCVGGFIGILAALGIGELAKKGGMEMTLSETVLIKSVLVLVVMAIVASIFSIRRAMSIDPARVFR
jgi:putative ABC transport system permease protein